MKIKTLISFLLLLVAIMPFFLMGIYYQSLGDLGGSVVLTLVVIGVMLLLLWGATVARAHVGRFSKIIHISGWVLGVIYFLIGFVYVVPKASHFFYVNNEQINIQAEADTVIAHTNDMFALYKKKADNRSARLEQEIKNTQTTPNGMNVFNQAYPNKNYSPQLPATERVAFYQVLMSDYNSIFDTWSNELEPAFREKLVQNFGLFSAPANVYLLVTTVDQYSQQLKNGFTRTSPMERLHNEMPEFKCSVNAENLTNRFTNDETSSVWNILIALLILLSGASFLLVKLDHVDSQRGKDPIYDQGIPF